MDGWTVRRATWAGARAIAPLLVGVVPFGIVAAVAVVERGLGTVTAFGFSTLLFAGASQLAAVEVLASGAPVAVAIGTVAIINLRFVMYSAALAPWLTEAPLLSRLAAAYPLTDQAFAVSVTAFRADEPPPRARLAFYAAAAGVMWAGWQLATAIGLAVGRVVPDGLPLDFALPLVFMVLLIPAVEDRATAAAAAVGGTVAVVAATFPAGTGLLVGAGAGIAVGVALAGDG